MDHKIDINIERMTHYTHKVYFTFQINWSLTQVIYIKICAVNVYSLKYGLIYSEYNDKDK